MFSFYSLADAIASSLGVKGRDALQTVFLFVFVFVFVLFDREDEDEEDMMPIEGMNLLRDGRRRESV